MGGERSSWEAGGYGYGSRDCNIEEVHTPGWCSAYYSSTPGSLSTRSLVPEESNRDQREEAESNNADPDLMISSLLGMDKGAVEALRKNPELHSLGRSYAHGILKTIELCASLLNLVARARQLAVVLQCAARPYAVYLRKLNTFREEGKQLRLKLFALNESMMLHQRMVLRESTRPGDDDLDAIQLLARRLLSKMQVLLVTAESYYDGGSDWRRVAKAITREATGFTSCTEELEGRLRQWKESILREVAVLQEEIAGQASSANA